jgi:hypothetical protein
MLLRLRAGKAELYGCMWGSMRRGGWVEEGQRRKSCIVQGWGWMWDSLLPSWELSEIQQQQQQCFVGSKEVETT